MIKHHLGPQLSVWIMQVSLFSSVLINRFHNIFMSTKHQWNMLVNHQPFHHVVLMLLTQYSTFEVKMFNTIALVYVYLVHVVKLTVNACLTVTLPFSLQVQLLNEKEEPTDAYYVRSGFLGFMGTVSD